MKKVLALSSILLTLAACGDKEPPACNSDIVRNNIKESYINYLKGDIKNVPTARTAGMAIYQQNLINLALSMAKESKIGEVTDLGTRGEKNEIRVCKVKIILNNNNLEKTFTVRNIPDSKILLTFID